MQQFDIDQLHLRLSSCETEEQKKETLDKLATHDKKRLMMLWTGSFKYPDYEDNIHSLSQIVQYLLSEQSIAASNEWLSQQAEEWGLGSEWINNMSAYLCQTRRKPDSIILSCCQLHKHKIDGGRFKGNLFFLRGILQSFEYIEEDNIRQRMMILVLDLMLQNPEFIKQANQPYYCLEYFVFQLNQEMHLPRALILLKYLADINLLPHSEKLFTANDYRAIVDVLIRHSENSEDEQTLIKLVQCYLVLSLNPNISSQGKYYQIDRMLVAAAGLKDKSKLGQQLLMELYEMKMESS